jgi:hypothetical protein
MRLLDVIAWSMIRVAAGVLAGRIVRVPALWFPVHSLLYVATSPVSIASGVVVFEGRGREARSDKDRFVPAFVMLRSAGRMQ